MKVNDTDMQRLFNDTHTLQNIKANPDKEAALQTASQQFEALFLQTVLKHMRQASDALREEEDGLFNSRQQTFYRDMLDGQLAVELSRQQSLGIADMLTRQLSQKNTVKTDEKTVVIDNQSTPGNVEPFAITTSDGVDHSAVTNHSVQYWGNGTVSLLQQRQFNPQAGEDSLALRGDE